MSIFYEPVQKGMSINTGNDVVYDQLPYLVTSNVLLLIAVIVKRCQIAPNAINLMCFRSNSFLKQN